MESLSINVVVFNRILVILGACAFWGVLGLSFEWVLTTLLGLNPLIAYIPATIISITAGVGVRVAESVYKSFQENRLSASEVLTIALAAPYLGAKHYDKVL